MDTSGAVSSARQAGDSDALENLARVGLIAYGIVHLLVAWLALQLAWGGGGGSADQSGAMAALASKPFGKPLLWVLASKQQTQTKKQQTKQQHQVPGLRSSGKARKKAITGSVKS